MVEKMRLMAYKWAKRGKGIEGMGEKARSRGEIALESNGNNDLQEEEDLHWKEKEWREEEKDKI